MRTIAHISDLHFNRVEARVAEALVADLQRRKPSLVVISGDLTQRGRGYQYRAAAAYLARLPRPQLVIPGNHDIPLFDVLRRMLLPLRRWRRYISTDLFPVHEDEEMLVMGVNTARSLTWKEGRVSVEQWQAVERRMAGVSERVLKVVVTHHPFLPVPGEPKTVLVGRAGRALAAFERAGVDLLLAGHLHLGYHGDLRAHHLTLRRSMLAVQANTATSTRRRRDEPNAYNWIVSDGPRLGVAVHAWQGQEFRETVATWYQRGTAGVIAV